MRHLSTKAPEKRNVVALVRRWIEAVLSTSISESIVGVKSVSVGQEVAIMVEYCPLIIEHSRG